MNEGHFYIKFDYFQDADAVARQILEPGQPAFKEIEETFGQSVIDETTGKIVSFIFSSRI